MATPKEKLLVLEIKANGHYLRQVAVTYRRGTSVVRNLKFLTPFFNSINQVYQLTSLYLLK